MRGVFGIALTAVLLSLVGAIGGALAGVVVGLTYTKLAHTSGFEGYAGLLVFLTFGPIGAMLGAVAAPVSYLALRSRRGSSSPL
jgi:hypothetical protein